MRARGESDYGWTLHSEAGAGRKASPEDGRKSAATQLACHHPDAPQQMCFDLKKYSEVGKEAGPSIPL